MQADKSDSKLMVQRKADMNEGRTAQGICAMKNYIYVAGGSGCFGFGTFSAKSIILDTCERYDILTDKWEQLP